MSTLWVLAESPWSERARWALLHHRVAFVEKKHLPMLGESLLRWRAKNKKATVPLLVEEHERTMGSMAIAKRAEVLGEGRAPALFPSEHVAAIEALFDEVEPMFQAARAIIIESVAGDDEAAREALPRAMRWMPGAAASGRMGARFLGRKYSVELAGAQERLRDGFSALRAKLGGRDTLHGSFTFADVIIASSLQFVVPVDDAYIPLGPATRRAWTNAPLADEFSDLVAWRDRLYAEHRPRA